MGVVDNTFVPVHPDGSGTTVRLVSINLLTFLPFDNSTVIIAWQSIDIDVFFGETFDVIYG